MSQTLRGLIAEWRQVAKAKFTQSELAESVNERQFIEHGAVCYANCAFQLEALLHANPMLDFKLQELQKHAETP